MKRGLFRLIIGFSLANVALSCGRQPLTEPTTVREAQPGSKTDPGPGMKLVYDSGSDFFATWTTYLTGGNTRDSIKLFRDKADRSPPFVALASRTAGVVGFNKRVPITGGIVSFEYIVISQTSSAENVIFYVIPMHGEAPESYVVLKEVTPAGQENGDTTLFDLRAKLVLAKRENKTGWEKAVIKFDFSQLSETNETIVGLRINEGSKGQSPAEARFRSILVYTSDPGGRGNTGR